MPKHSQEKFTFHERKCPKCQSDNLLKFETDSFCCECDWDSTKAAIDAGQLDSYWRKDEMAKRIFKMENELIKRNEERVENEKAS